MYATLHASSKAANRISSPIWLPACLAPAMARHFIHQDESTDSPSLGERIMESQRRALIHQLLSSALLNYSLACMPRRCGRRWPKPTIIHRGKRASERAGRLGLACLPSDCLHTVARSLAPLRASKSKAFSSGRAGGQPCRVPRHRVCHIRVHCSSVQSK